MTDCIMNIAKNKIYIYPLYFNSPGRPENVFFGKRLLDENTPFFNFKAILKLSNRKLISKKVNKKNSFLLFFIFFKISHK